MSVDALFRPFTYKSLTLPNRIVMAPMTRSFSPGHQPTAEVAAYYRRRAENDVGLILTEGTGIERPASLNDPDVPMFHGEALGGWGRVVEAVHDAGGLIAPQLWHVGSARNARTEWRAPGPVDSPSGLSSPGKKFGDAMSDADVGDAIAAFARAAADAERLGFDAIELHGAHGYLIDQFFWAGTNERDAGAHGGPTIGERSQFAAEILRAVRAAVSDDFVVIIRLSQWKQQDFSARLAETPAEMEQWLQPLADAGADIFHCSQRRFWEPEFPEVDGSALNFAGWARKITGQPTITVGSVGLSGEFISAFGGESSDPASLDQLVERLERDEFDLVAVGRALLQDPEWVVKVRDGRSSELKSFQAAAMATLY